MNEAFCFSASARHLGGEIARDIAIECHDVCATDTVRTENNSSGSSGGSPSASACSSSRRASLHGRFGFRRSPSFDVDERGDERYLKIDLHAAQRGRAGQGRDLVEGALELFNGLDQRRALHRPLSRLAPQAHRLLDQPGLGAVTRQQLGLALGDLGELAFECFGDASMKRPSRLAQQRAVSRVLHQGVLEQVGRVRRYTLPEQQTGVNETVERRFNAASGLRTTAASRE